MQVAPVSPTEHRPAYPAAPQEVQHLILPAAAGMESRREMGSARRFAKRLAEIGAFRAWVVKR